MGLHTKQETRGMYKQGEKLLQGRTHPSGGSGRKTNCGTYIRIGKIESPFMEALEFDTHEHTSDI